MMTYCISSESNLTSSIIMQPPAMPGFTIAWSDNFAGSAGTPPLSTSWTIETPETNSNGEQQKYTDSTQNAYLSGTGELVIAPVYNGVWTSARMHGNRSIACASGGKMIFAASVKVGQNSPAQQQGIWPAFWTLGDSVNHGVSWPTCCEWDILELGNGESKNQGTLHQTGPDGQPASQSGFVDFSHGDFHTWGLEVDLTGDYPVQTLTWLMDGQAWYTVKCEGTSAADIECWNRCAHQAFFPILNVAVGGNFVGAPDGETLGGVESGLTVEWVAVYQSV